MKLSRSETEHPHRHPSFKRPSLLGYRRRLSTGSSTGSSTGLLPLITPQHAPRPRTFSVPQQTPIDPGHWRLPRRPRRLSIPLAEHENGREPARNTDDQIQSLIFKLPRNVRVLIYEFFIGNGVLHVVRRRNKLGHKACRAERKPDVCVNARCRGVKVEMGLHNGTGDGDLIQLLQSCRKIYTEAIPLLYSHPTFSFDSLETFLAFSCAVLPSRFDSIRHLQLDLQFSTAGQFSESHPDNNMPRWERTWRVIATMRDLEELKMRIDWPRRESCRKELTVENEVMLLEPLKLVEGLGAFEVALPRLKGSETVEMRDLPFRIRRYESEELL